MNYRVIDLREVEVRPLNELISNDFALIVKDFEEPTRVLPCERVPKSDCVDTPNSQLDLYGITPVPYQSALEVLENYRKVSQNSSYLCYIEPLCLPNRKAPIRFIGYQVSQSKTNIFHIYFYDTLLPDFCPVDQSTATAIYQLHCAAGIQCKLEINWDSPLSLKSLPNISPNYCKVSTQGAFGENSLLSDLQNDLQIIKSLVNFGKKFKFPTTCTEKVARFIDSEIEIQKENINQYDQDKGISRLREEKIAEYCKMEERKDLDITDRMWDLLKNAKNFEELHTSFLAIMKSIKEKRLFPLISYRNRTLLGIHLNKWSNLLQKNKIGGGDANCEEKNWVCRSESFANEIVDALVEIGLHKLGQDFVDYLVTGNYLGTGEIEWFVEKQFCGKEESTERLERLLKIVQIAIILKSAGLKVHVISEALIPLVRFYKENNGFPVLEHVLNSAIDQQFLKYFRLLAWSTSVTSAKAFSQEVSKYSYTNSEWWVLVSETFLKNC